MRSFKVVGMAKVLREIDRLERGIDREVEEEIKRVCDLILSDALSRVPVDKGGLKASAYVNRISNGWAVGFSATYAPYQEFGSGSYTVVPSGYNDFAMEFFVDGSGTTRPQPFLFPAFLAKRDNIVIDLERKLNEYIKSK